MAPKNRVLPIISRAARAWGVEGMGLSGRRRGRVFMQERLQPRPSAPSPAKAGEGWGGVPFGSARTVGTPSQPPPAFAGGGARARGRSEEHTSELQSLMRISYAVFCLTKNTHNKTD